MTDAAFYREEAQAYRGLWKLPVSADHASEIVRRVLRRMGEPTVAVHVVPDGTHHQAFPEHIEFCANDITPQTIAHEVAHVIQYRERGTHCPDHDADAWNLVALTCCVLEEVL